MRRSIVFTDNGIKLIEEKYGATFVMDTDISDGKGGWCNHPAAMFYQPNPKEGHTNYFLMFLDPMHGGPLIRNGLQEAQGELQAIVADNGEIVRSVYRHHFVTSKDGSVSSDGGRDYGRFMAKDLERLKTRVVNLKVNKDKLEVIP